MKWVLHTTTNVIKGCSGMRQHVLACKLFKLEVEILGLESWLVARYNVLHKSISPGKRMEEVLHTTTNVIKGCSGMRQYVLACNFFQTRGGKSFKLNGLGSWLV